jgi:ribosomal protein RSM22 (predicted rRNA methylase)
MPNSSGYPEALETAWLQHAMHITHVREPRFAAERLEEAAGSLSDAFTTGRDPDFTGYRNNRRALAAYGLFFFPRAYERTRLALRECRARGAAPDASRPLRIVDLGAGTGAAGLACLQELSAWFPDTPLHLDVVDCASAGINLSRSIFSAGRALWPRAAINEISGDARTHEIKPRADIVLCSFAINEWMEQQPDEALFAWVAGQMRALKPGGWLILLEPALHTAVERMERLRDKVAASGEGRIIAPCPHHAACPMLAEKRGWCHEVRAWPVPQSLRWINRRLQRDVHLLKFSLLALENSPRIPEAGSWMRLVSPVSREKGKYVCYGCGSDGKMHRCEWLTRNLSEANEALSEALERGDRVAFTGASRLADGLTERLDGPPQKR